MFLISEFNELLEKYDVFLIDLWGVVHDGTVPYIGVVDKLNHMISIKKEILFLSNVPRPATIMLQKLIEFGINVKTDMIVTSGDAVREQLVKWDDDVFSRLGHKLYHLGADRNEDILASIDVNEVNVIEDADFVLLTAFLEEEENSNKFDLELSSAYKANLPMICANPDTFVPHGNSTRKCAGVIAKRYEDMGGKVYYYGKPDSKIYEFAMRKLKEKGTLVSKDKILMIGDTFDTDIMGGGRFGIKTALTLTGNGNKVYPILDELEKTYKIRPTHVIKTIV